VAERALCVSGNIDPRDFAESFSSSIDAVNRELIGAVLPLLEQDLIRQELSGLMGRGDHDAIVEVQAGLARIGLKPTLPEVTEANLSAAQLSGNLIVVGGPDVNSITRSLLGRLPAKLSIVRNADGRNIVRDLVHGHDFVPAEDESGRIRDYGILVRAANPDDRQKNVLILAGAHGFGTLAAAMVAFDKENLDRMLRSGSGFECLVYHERGGARGAAPTSTLYLMREFS